MADILILILICGYSVYLIRCAYRNKKAGKSIGCAGCSGCGGSCGSCGHGRAFLSGGPDADKKSPETKAE